jgi:hypothetical protein
MGGALFPSVGQIIQLLTWKSGKTFLGLHFLCLLRGGEESLS